eukprot:TRINITY_DN20541_c0_g2_i3.p2 TRINITY_DN20541_c0_g2~~TRINITY_DN20541_c0_g2_i3.p2  ORF type:complete len:169 (-),score=27.57 TRINITY_DN20541_c0_g2_i3:310-816(-)
MYSEVSKLCIKAVEKAQSYREQQLEDYKTGQEFVQAVRDEGVKLMCELLSSGLNCMLKMAKSLSNTSNFAKSLSSIKWPEDVEQVVALIKAVALRLLQDLSAVNEAFLNAIVAIGEVVSNRYNDPTLGQLANDLASGYSRDIESGIKIVKDVYGQFYNVVLTWEIRTY